MVLIKSRLCKRQPRTQLLDPLDFGATRSTNLFIIPICKAIPPQIAPISRRLHYPPVSFKPTVSSRKAFQSSRTQPLNPSPTCPLSASRRNKGVDSSRGRTRRDAACLSEDVGGCQNDGPFLDTLNTRCRILIGTQKGTIILTTTHVQDRELAARALRTSHIQ